MGNWQPVRPLVEGKLVLDLGCGDGGNLRNFRRGSVGIDLDLPRIRALAAEGLAVVVADLNVGIPLRAESFDVVLCSHSLEHVAAPAALLREAHRVVKGGGLIIITLPVEKSLARFLLRDDYFRNHPSHLYGFSRECLKRLLEHAGFNCRRCFADLPGARKLRWLGVTSFGRRLPFRLVSWLAANLWVIGEKPE